MAINARKLAVEANAAHEEMFLEEMDPYMVGVIEDGTIPDRAEAERMLNDEELSKAEFDAVIAAFDELEG